MGFRGQVFPREVYSEEVLVLELGGTAVEVVGRGVCNVLACNYLNKQLTFK